jgi:hypothetical protein
MKDSKALHKAGAGAPKSEQSLGLGIGDGGLGGIMDGMDDVDEVDKGVQEG